ncbi:hypothetical protein P175DRAFT_063403 [Aspergillus ochraceoroseus IBT 24754]|uniref:Uncharacterized protein n=1 Tax=Aspergillus ochraceoroseus IBT 24754 TaxID=1392256 RepID=A0A2T5M999_9EURO|nr:uncharacterized protein P175DRAFT_063403 [Aspergillus ochraceoroseus IBT 24754]PTU25106.1 hypothetical protein P175DRAFT_063403 [Aspergillus ochraceoroseus IBT 24754]
MACFELSVLEDMQRRIRRSFEFNGKTPLRVLEILPFPDARLIYLVSFCLISFQGTAWSWHDLIPTTRHTMVKLVFYC